MATPEVFEDFNYVKSLAMKETILWAVKVFFGEADGPDNSQLAVFHAYISRIPAAVRSRAMDEVGSELAEMAGTVARAAHPDMARLRDRNGHHRGTGQRDAPAHVPTECSCGLLCYDIDELLHHRRLNTDPENHRIRNRKRIASGRLRRNHVTRATP